MIHTASYFKPEHWLGSIYRITRYPPKGPYGKKVYTGDKYGNDRQFGDWGELPVFYPSNTILFGYKNGKLSWEQYRDRYCGELNWQYEKDETLNNLLPFLEQVKDFTLLCFEPEGEHCHRLLAAEWLAEHTGLEIGHLR